MSHYLFIIMSNLVKVCPECCASVNVKKTVCDCGHKFVFKSKVSFDSVRKSKRVAMRRKRALESPTETMDRREQDRANTKKRRALESPCETMDRREQDRANTEKKRALESPCETMDRREQDRANTEKKRALETPCETMDRREQDRANTKKKRALETPCETMDRREHDRTNTAKKRALPVTTNNAIANFLSKTKMGPDFVCTICHRMMYKQNVIPCNKSKYTKASHELLEQAFCVQYSYTSSDGRQWICKTCDSALSRGNLPAQAKANNLQLNDIPIQLSTLNALELRLISLRVPFMKMVALPSGKQRCIQGPAVNVPSKLDSLCTMLPRLPTESELVALKLKRKLKYKGHYMYDYVCPEKLIHALEWLKANNPLYADVHVNMHWAAESQTCDSDLFHGLVMLPETNSHDCVPNNTPQEHTHEPCGDPMEWEITEPTHSIFNYGPDELITASNTLKALATEEGFTVHDVPGDGNCLFNAIAYQLEFTNASQIRQSVTVHLESNAIFYRDFLAQPIRCSNAHNADTEAPNDEDAFIDTVHQSEQQLQLRFEKYVSRLRNGAWGDHVAIQGISDRFNIAINVLSSEHSNMIRVIPRNGTIEHEVYIGLILQYHYVGLDKVAVSDSNSQNTTTDPNDTDDPLNDDIIAEGDEHIRQITGGPQASMMSLENPEAFSQTVSIAPAEGQKPLSIMTDTNFEAMVNPDKFCFGIGTFSTERPRKLTYRKYFNQRLLDVDGRFARDLDYLFVAQYIVEAKQVLDDGNNYIWRQKPQARQFTASQARDKTLLNQYIRSDKAYSFMKNVRGSPPYYQRTFYDLLAMIRQLGTPTWFFTLSAADMKWPDMISTIAKQYGVHYSDEEVEALSFQQKSNWLRRNPVTAARHFHYRLNTFFHEFLKSTANPLGEIVDYGIRIEFQARGSPHAHCVIWVKDAPKYGIDSDEEVCAFIDQYITCAVPQTEGKLRDLVLLLQQHKHSTYCKRKKSCRFNFPKPPSSKTLIAAPESDSDVVENAQTILAQVHKVLSDGNTELSLLEVLIKADISLSEYTKALEVSSKGNVVVLKRQPNECNINNYNGPVTLAWQANTDIQYVLNAYACIMYVASYIMKTDRAMGQLLKQVASEARTDELKQQLRKVGSAFLTHREVSAQEAVYRILSLPMKQLSRSVVFVDTNPKSERIAMLKSKDMLSQLDDDDTDVFNKSLIDRYQHRPRELQSMCLAEFAATFVTNYRHDDDNCDALPPTESEILSKTIKLTDGFGKMNRRKREAVIRFHKYNKDAEPSNWYRAKLMLYYPWYNEHVDLLGGYATYQEHYRHVQSIVQAHEQKYCHDEVDNVNLDENGPPEHLWTQIAPSTEEARQRALAEGSQLLTDVSQEDLRDNHELMTSTTTSLHARFESASNSQEIAADEYRNLLRKLNSKQRDMVMFHRNWCKNAVIALKQGKSIEPYRVFLSGPGGVGKSHVIRLIHSDTIKFFKQLGTFQPDDVIVLLTAPTGVAAFNINGMTLHSAFLLGTSKYAGFQPLGHDKLNTLRTKLSNLALIIIDEVSMVGSNMLLEIHKRLQQIKGVSADVTFGGVSILAVGDLYQLPPVGQPWLFATVSDSYAQLYRSGSLWVDEFEMIELSEIMRQRGDTTFAQMLCRVRTSTCTPADIDMLKSREITADLPNYPNHALHVYRLNVDVDSRNTVMLNNLAPQCEQYSIKASDAMAGQTAHIELSTLSNKRQETGGLHSVLKLAIGARVMLTTNVDVSDGLVNGARGEVMHVVTNDDNKVTTVLVKFDNDHVGLKAMQSSPYRTIYTHAVPVAKYEIVFPAKGKKGSEITRLQFPLTLAWATTIHKVQGLTLEQIVVDMKGGRFSPGQAYVAFSRVKTLQGLHILNFNPKAIKASTDVQNEMIRLNNKLLPSATPLQFLSLPENYITICLLNVRSLVAKLTDIEQDMYLKATNIVCFCETWLTASQTSPSILNDQVVVRCDRQTSDNKGGTMICIPRQMHPTHTCSFTSSGIEVACSTLTLSNGNKMNISVIYRSPTVPLQALTTMLSTLLAYVSTANLPTVILGDFNEDILSRPNSSIVSLMSNHGYTQLVSTPTTSKATLIDHVYYNRPSDNTIVQVHDTYYSDHDAVYCSISHPI